MALVAPKTHQQQTIEWLETPRHVGNFRLHSAAGEFDNDVLAGRWTIVSFGFLKCPDVCPTNLAQLAQLARRAAPTSMAEHLVLVFVSVDPARDSVAEVARYAGHFDPTILGVTGETAQLTRLAHALGVQFKVTAHERDYQVAHSIAFSIIGPDGALRGRFRPGFDVTDLIRGLEAKISARGGVPGIAGV